jgi:hypothetical protein
MMGRQARASAWVMRLWNRMILDVRACISLFGITSRTRQTHRRRSPDPGGRAGTAQAGRRAGRARRCARALCRAWAAGAGQARAVHDRRGFDNLRGLRLAQAGRRVGAHLRCAATIRRWHLAPAPATCWAPGCAAATPTPAAPRPARHRDHQPDSGRGRHWPADPAGRLGLYAHPVVQACQRAGVRYSITSRLTNARSPACAASRTDLTAWPPGAAAPAGEGAAAPTDRRVMIRSAPARCERPRNTSRLIALVLMSNSRAAGAVRT